MLFNLDLANNTILSSFFFFFLIIDSYFQISAIIAQISDPVAELVIPIGIPAKGAKKKMETNPVVVEAKIRKCSI